jgi:hypothetical protein
MRVAKESKAKDTDASQFSIILENQLSLSGSSLEHQLSGRMKRASILVNTPLKSQIRFGCSFLRWVLHIRFRDSKSCAHRTPFWSLFCKN